LSNARNLGLDPIKSKVVITLLLYECPICSAFSSDQSQHAPASILRLVIHSRVYGSQIAIHQRNAGPFAQSEKSDTILTGQSHILEVENNAANFPFRADERFQLRNVVVAGVCIEMSHISSLNNLPHCNNLL
jgi:hypothetical protein